MAEAFTDEEIKSLRQSKPPALSDKKMIELADEVHYLNCRFLATIAADRKRFNEVELNYLKIVAENAITIADQTAVIERLRDTIKQVHVHLELHPDDWPRTVHDRIGQALDAGKEEK